MNIPDARRLLVIAFRFPPHSGVGTLPPMALARYLPAFGWTPIVLTGDGRGFHTIDHSQLADMPPGVEIVRAPWLGVDSEAIDRWGLRKVRRGLTLDKTNLGWVPTAVLAGARIMRGRGVSALYSSSNPFGPHLVAYWLKKRFNTPWVAYIHDEYSLHPHARPPTPAHRWLMRRLDLAVLRSADVVSTWTEGYRQQALALSGRSDGHNFTVRPIGFEMSEFPEFGQPRSWPANSRFTLGYVGSFFPGRSGEALLDALEALLAAGAIPAEKIRLQLVGNTGHPVFRNPRFQDVIRVAGFVSSQEAVRYRQSADALVLINPGVRGVYDIPGKTLEYIASGVPLLVLTPAGSELEPVITRTRAGVLADVNDPAAVQDAILGLYRRWEAGTLTAEREWEAIREFSWDVIVGRQAQLLDRLVMAK